MPDGQPYLVAGTAVAGLGIPTVGLPIGEGPRDGSLNAGEVVVEFATLRPEVMAASSVAMEAYLDGKLVDVSRDGADAVRVSGLRPGVVHSFDLLPLSTAQAEAATDSSPIFAGRIGRAGNRACIRWTDKPTDGDFDSYRLYWDAGDGMGADTLLATITDRDQTEHRTAVLDAGTYVFAIAYRDRLGNESALGGTKSVVIVDMPLPVEDLALAYNQTTRQATLTWTNPTQPTGVRQILVFDNWHPGASFNGPHPNADTMRCRAMLDTTDEAWTSANLWQAKGPDGQLAPWRFAVVPMLCDAYGTRLAAPVEVAVTLKLNGSDLEEVDATPPRPELLLVEPIAGGAFRATWRLPEGATETDVVEYAVLVDGSSADTVAKDGSPEYEYESDPLTDGQTYSVAIRAVNGDALADSDAIDVTVDDTAPTGDGVIAGEACW